MVRLLSKTIAPFLLGSDDIPTEFAGKLLE